MLNRKEKAVMHIVYDKAMSKNKSCIVTDGEILNELNPKLKVQVEEIPAILEMLEYDGYYELVKSDKKGEPVKVITLRQKGEAFPRELVQAKRRITERVITTIIFSILGAAVALLFRSLFS